MGGDSGIIMTSSDGTTWTERQATSAGEPSISDIAQYSAGWVVSGALGSYQLSADGLSWNTAISLTTKPLIVGGNKKGCLVAADGNGPSTLIWEAVG